MKIPANVTIGDVTPAQTEQLLTRSEKWHAERRQGIGGSDAARIMAGDWQPVWEEKTGIADPENLDDVLPVLLGAWTEPLNRLWFERRTGMVVDLADTGSQVHPDYVFVRANLDGRVGMGVFEAKHVNAFAKFDTITADYYPQSQHLMLVTGAPVCYFSALIGTFGWHYAEIEADPDYQDSLLERYCAFWDYVARGEEPGSVAPGLPSLLIDPAPLETRDMADNIYWQGEAESWLRNAEAAANFNRAEKNLRRLVPPEVGHAFGCGVAVKRNHNKALVIRRQKDTDNDW